MIVYYKLFDLMNRNKIKVGDLIAGAGITGPVAAKLKKGAAVNTDTINKICKYLQVQPGDIMEFIPDQQPDKISQQ